MITEKLLKYKNIFYKNSIDSPLKVYYTENEQRKGGKYEERKFTNF